MEALARQEAALEQPGSRPQALLVTLDRGPEAIELGQRVAAAREKAAASRHEPESGGNAQ